MDANQIKTQAELELQATKQELAKAEYKISAFLHLLRHDLGFGKDAVQEIMRRINERADYIFSDEEGQPDEELPELTAEFFEKAQLRMPRG